MWKYAFALGIHTQGLDTGWSPAYLAFGMILFPSCAGGQGTPAVHICSWGSVEPCTYALWRPWRRFLVSVKPTHASGASGHSGCFCLSSVKPFMDKGSGRQSLPNCPSALRAFSLTTDAVRHLATVCSGLCKKSCAGRNGFW